MRAAESRRIFRTLPDNGHGRGPGAVAPDRHARALPQPLGYLITGLSQRLPRDDTYTAFIEMLGAATSAALGNARAYEMERARSDALVANLAGRFS